MTRLLEQCRAGEERALGQLLPIVYEQLRALAQRELGREHRGHTLQPTALVHEAYLRLVEQRDPDWQDRRHFFAIAATAMRRVLINHAHARRALKRGGGGERVTLFEAASAFEERAEDLLAVDEGLRRLGEVDPEKCRIVELRFFAGLGVVETAEVLGVSASTVERGWRFARAWLRREIAGAS